jgi:hypothetical protein
VEYLHSYGIVHRDLKPDKWVWHLGLIKMKCFAFWEVLKFISVINLNPVVIWVWWWLKCIKDSVFPKLTAQTQSQGSSDGIVARLQSGWLGFNSQWG